MAATPAADAMTGGALARGVSIVKALCGDAPERPIAEALAAGRPANGAIVRAGPDGVMRTLEVCASPMQRDGRIEALNDEGDRRIGHVARDPVATLEGARAADRGRMTPTDG